MSYGQRDHCGPIATTKVTAKPPWGDPSPPHSEGDTSHGWVGCSCSAWLKDTADPVVRALEQRIGAVTGLDLRPPYAEYLQVVNYGLGGHYEPHFDHATVREMLGGCMGWSMG